MSNIIKSFNQFREFLNVFKLEEERSFNEYGLDVQGHLLDLSIRMGKSSLVEVNVQGKRTLVKLKSIDRLKKEYQENNHAELENIWKQLADKKSKDIEILVEKFERDLNSIIIEMEKEILEIK